MKGVEVYHAIHVLRTQNNSIREIADMLDISKTTVVEYLKLNCAEAAKKLSAVNRPSKLAPFEAKYRKILERYPKYRASRLYRDFIKEYPEVQISDRTFRNFIRKIKDDLDSKEVRYFTPVDYAPGVQMQVDPGEFKVRSFSGEQFKVYFIVFILSYSRKKYVYFQTRPINTTDFIHAHNSCFDHLGYIPQQMVYDQTKLVVIKEKYREVWYNQKFIQYLTSLEISPYVCEGYDPQSKGLVERAVREVKEDFLYGTDFLDIDDIRCKSLSWFEAVNSRVNATTKQKPDHLFTVEKNILRPYNPSQYEPRKCDKLGFISWKSNKYSVPYLYQQKMVLVKEERGLVHIISKDSKAKLASHKIPYGKGNITKNSNHYRDYSQLLTDVKNDTIEIFSIYSSGTEFVEKLVKDNPDNPRDQLRAIKGFHKKYQPLNWDKIIGESLNFAITRASNIEKMIVESIKQEKLKQIKNKLNVKSSDNSLIQRSLKFYEGVYCND